MSRCPRHLKTPASLDPVAHARVRAGSSTPQQKDAKRSQ